MNDSVMVEITEAIGEDYIVNWSDRTLHAVEPIVVEAPSRAKNFSSAR